VQPTGCITESTKEREMKLPQEKFDKIMERTLPKGWTFGYIGNLSEWGDERSWMIFPPEQGYSMEFPKVKSIGGFSTETRDKLLPIANGIGKAYAVLENLNNKQMEAI
jgi:hypothetical protein